MKKAIWVALAMCGAVACGEKAADQTPPSTAAETASATRTEPLNEATNEEVAQQNEARPDDPAQAPEVAAVGRPAPDFTLTDQAGQQHRLSDYRGRIVVLEWINPQCPYVQRHYQARTMTNLEQEFPDDRVVWLAVDSSHFVTPESSQEWRTQHGITYPILQDPQGTVGRLYGARTTPHMYVIDGEGTLRYAGAIDDDPRGRNEAPTNHVARAVRALLNGEEVPVQTTEPYGCTVKYENT
jgi:peroxiredoxin